MKIKSQSVISVVGPTATGKTSLALKIARGLVEHSKITGVDLISADSKQVYKGLEILTGADVPPGFQQSQATQAGYHFFAQDPLKLHGVSIIKPFDEWSVAHFRQFGQEIIGQAKKNNRAVIVVGGTGLYHRHLFSSDDRLDISPNIKLRAELADSTLEEMQQRLKALNNERFQQMNNSDRNNPRRLIRAIEITLAEKNQEPVETSWADVTEIRNQVIGVQDDLTIIEDRIAKRVADRFAGGAVQEVSALLGKFETQPNAPVFATLGFNEVADYLSRKTDAELCQQMWALHEFQYAKRQLTWWKNEAVNWVKAGERIEFA